MFPILVGQRGGMPRPEQPAPPHTATIGGTVATHVAEIRASLQAHVSLRGRQRIAGRGLQMEVMALAWRQVEAYARFRGRENRLSLWRTGRIGMDTHAHGAGEVGCVPVEAVSSIRGSFDVDRKRLAHAVLGAGRGLASRMTT